MTKMEFCLAVDQMVQEQYGVEDGGDLCYNLIDANIVSMSDSLITATNMVAQHMMQP